MKYMKFKILFFCMIAGLILQSCSEDNGITEVADLSELRGGDNNGPGGGPGGGNNGPPNEPQNDQNVSLLDSDIVHDWTEVMLEIERYATGMRPNATARALAYTYLAAYETAVNGMERHESTSRNLEDLQIRKERLPRRVDWELALNASFAKTLDHFLLNIPNDLREKIEAFELEIQSGLIDNQSDRLIEDSQRWGRYVASEVIKYSQSDAAAEEQILEPQPLSYEPPTGDGYWTYSANPERALFPYWSSVRTFVISPDETTTVAPNRL